VVEVLRLLPQMHHLLRQPVRIGGDAPRGSPDPAPTPPEEGDRPGARRRTATPTTSRVEQPRPHRPKSGTYTKKPHRAPQSTPVLRVRDARSRQVQTLLDARIRSRRSSATSSLQEATMTSTTVVREAQVYRSELTPVDLLARAAYM